MTTTMVALFAVTSSAQTDVPKDRKAAHEAWKTQVKTTLELTEQQTKSWDQIEERYRLQRKAYKEQHRAQIKAHKKRMKESREAQKAEIDALLTPEQRTKLEEFREAEKARRKAEREKHGDQGFRERR